MTLVDRVASESAERLRADPRQVVVIDDDPTGTQTVSGVRIVLQPSAAAYASFFGSTERVLYVLSNSRALAAGAAVELVTEITTGVRTAAAAADRSVALVYRGDSTLRGHVFAETDAVASASAVILFVPAYPEGGRVTLDGVQWLRDGNGDVAVSDTEFARDRSFGYQSRALSDWVREVGGGRRSIVVPLAELRAGGPAAVRDALLAATPGSVVIPEAELRSDVEIAVHGLLDAETAGASVVVRCASTFAALRAGLEPRAVGSVALAAPGRVLVICGSHTTASSSQLERLAASARRPVVILPTAPALAGDPEHPTIRRVTRALRDQLDHDGIAIVATERDRHHDQQDLGSGERVMAALTTLVRSIRGSCDGVIVKGGITSAEVARAAFGAGSALVVGQVAPGVALWHIDVDARAIPFAVVPGNIGDGETLVAVARRFGVAC